MNLRQFSEFTKCVDSKLPKKQQKSNNTGLSSSNVFVDDVVAAEQSTSAHALKTASNSQTVSSLKFC